MPSFDIVSEIDNVELRHAVDNSNRELSTRFDFRDVKASFEIKDTMVKLSAEGDFQLSQMIGILRTNMAKRGVEANSMQQNNPYQTGKNWFQELNFVEGIDTPTAKKIVKLIKDNKLKVQAAIQGDKVRVTGKKRDDLQSVIALIKSSDAFDLPFQFNNFRD